MGVCFFRSPPGKMQHSVWSASRSPDFTVKVATLLQFLSSPSFWFSIRRTKIVDLFHFLRSPNFWFLLCASGASCTQFSTKSLTKSARFVLLLSKISVALFMQYLVIKMIYFDRMFVTKTITFSSGSTRFQRGTLSSS